MYVSQKQPWAHQVRALAELNGREAFALLMAMRTGKTKVTLDDFGRLEDAGSVHDMLVVAPAGVYRTWETAIADHVGSSLLGRLMVHTWQARDKGQRADRVLAAFMASDRPRVLLMNVEALSAVARARELCKSFLQQRRCMLVVDESTTIKNAKSNRGAFLVGLRPLAAYRRILTGLPTPRSPLDLYNQYNFLDPSIIGYSNVATFTQRYAIVQRTTFGGRLRWPIDIIVGYRNEEELKQKIAPHSFRVLLEDCYDLPPKLYMKREVTMTPEQTRHYNELKHFATTELASMDHVTATHVLTRLLRLHQILCGHIKDEHGNTHTIPTNRIAELLAQLEESPVGKVVVWCSYDADVHAITAALKERYGEQSVARFWGGNLNTREEEERVFKSSPTCRFMVATPAAGGRGRTWGIADLVIYYSNTDNLEHRSQSEDRTQGIGKTTSVAYVDLVVPGTVDEKILQSLRKKINMATTITGDDWRAWIV